MERIEVNKAQDFVGKIQRSIDEMRGLIGIFSISPKFKVEPFRWSHRETG